MSGLKSFSARNPGIFRLFILMLFRPRRGVTATVGAAPEIRTLALSLAAVGLLRGAVEGFWYYLMRGELEQLLTMLSRPDWYLVYGGPFLLLNIPSAHFLWLTTAVILHVTGNMLAGRGHFLDVLRVTGVAMHAYLLIGLLNYLHLFITLPSLSLSASPFYSPNLGAGQIVVLTWLMMVCYHLQRRVHALDKSNALLAAPLPVTVSLILYLSSSALFFHGALLLPVQWTPRDLLIAANVLYMGATIVLSLAMVWMARPWLRMRRWLRR